MFCEDLINYSVIEDLCNGCGLCRKNCPAQCIDGEQNKLHNINSDSCLKCALCYTLCPNKAIEKITNPMEGA
jgi:NAD-dependent dihydropyrimidine dehydrogenase PreA subunit